MKQILILAGFEYKKIWKRKSTWLAMIIIFGLTILSGMVNELGNIYVDGSAKISVYDNTMQQKQEMQKYVGKPVDVKMLSQAQEAYIKSTLQYISNTYDSEEEWKQYVTYIRPYIEIYSLIAAEGEDIYKTDVTHFYEYRIKNMQKNYKSENLSDDVIAKHMEYNEKVKIPFLYSYAKAYDKLITMLSSIGVLISFAVSICIAPLFAGEYTSNMGSLILASRYGKNKIIIAKLLTGFSFALLVTVFFYGIAFLECGFIYGFEGAEAPIQLNALWMSYPLTMGGTAGIMMICVSTAVLAITGITMFCSAKMKTPFGVIIIITIILYGPMFINVPTKYTWLYMLVNLLPNNLIAFWGAFSGYLLKVGKYYFIEYQYAPVLYLSILLILSVFTYRGFQRHQIL